MEKAYRVIAECYDKNNPKKVVSPCSVLEGDINKLTNCMDFEDRRNNLHFLANALNIICY